MNRKQLTVGKFGRHNLAWFLVLALVTFITPAVEVSAGTIYVSGPSTNASPLGFTAIGAGAQHSLGIQSNGTVVAWGDNTAGQATVPGGLSAVRAVAGGDYFSLALKSDGTVVAWGRVTNVPNGLANVVAIAAGGGHGLALRSNGYVTAWGDNSSGQANVPGDLFDAVAIAAGDSHNLALKSDGTVEAWGDNTYGQSTVPAGLGNVVAIAAGVRHSLALKSDGTVVAWGSSIYDETNVPGGLSGVIAISSYRANCAALKSDGTVVTWGANHSVPDGLDHVMAIATGTRHDLALRSNGSVVAWGDNQFGQTLVPGASTTDHNIQDAVNAANDGDTVLVGPGQYNLTNQITITKAIKLQSEMGAGQTYLNTMANIWCLWISNSLAVADGFTMQNPSGPNLEQAGGAFLVGGTVQNCTFTNIHLGMMGASVFMNGGTLSNSAVYYARSPIGPVPAPAAVYCSDAGLITDSKISGAGASSGDAIGAYLVDSQLRNTAVSGVGGPAEEASGAAVQALRSTIVGCSITHNLNTAPGGGAYLENCLMDRCVVAYNISWSTDAKVGGGGIFESNSVIRDSLIVSNTDQNLPDTPPGGVGGGVFMRGGALVNCTVSANGVKNCPSPPPDFSGYGAGVYVESGGITNCIIYGNYCFGCVGGENDWFNAGPGVFDHCCTTPDPGGVGNITQDPQFLDPTDGNYHLASTSPCLGAGIVQNWMTGASDLDGNSRTSNGMVDMGAYETQSVTSRPVLRIFMTSSNTVVVAWPASASGYVLEQCPQTGMSSWSTPDVTYVVVNGENRVTFSTVAGGMCYRLRHP
jgi:hypothetical protein